MSVLPMAMALYGLAGYNNFKANQRERARQDEDDAFKREERARTRESWKAEDKLKTDVADAYAPRTTMSGTVTDTEQGKYFSSSPENAAVMQDTLSAEAELRGATAPVQQAGYAITGKMSKGHQIASGQAPAEFQDTDKDRFQRAFDAYRANGQFEKAALMEKGILDLESKRIGLKTEELDFANKQFNLKIDKYLSDPQGWEWGLARALSDTNVSGLNGLTFTPKKSDDGKSFIFEGRDQSGKVVVEKAYPSGDQGLLKVREEFTRVAPEEKIRYLNERFKAEKDQANKDRELSIREREVESNERFRTGSLGIQQSQEDRLLETHRLAMADAKIPPGVKLNAQTLADQLKSVDNALNKAMAEGQFDPNNAGTQKLIEQRAALSAQYRNLMSPYLPGATGPTADPPGFSGGSPSPSAKASPSRSATAPAQSSSASPMRDATRVSPQVQAARDSDARAVLQSELAKAQQRLAAGDSRAQADIQALEAEIKRAGGVVAPMAAATAPASVAPAPASQPVAPMSQATRPAPPATPAAPPAPAVRTQTQAQATQPSVLQVLAGANASPAMLNALRGTASAIESAAAEVKAAQAAVVSAAKSENQANLKQAMDQAAAAGERLRQMLSGMNQQQAATVIKAVGL